MKTINEIKNDKNLMYYHTVSRRGYISRKSDGEVEKYDGRFGKGYIIVTPRFDTTQHVNISYYIEREEVE